MKTNDLGWEKRGRGGRAGEECEVQTKARPQAAPGLASVHSHIQFRPSRSQSVRIQGRLEGQQEKDPQPDQGTFPVWAYFEAIDTRLRGTGQSAAGSFS